MLNDVALFPGYLERAAQEAIVEELRTLAGVAPFRRYSTPGGKALSVRMTAAGHVGWFTDSKGYRYVEAQPDGTSWPAIPTSFLDIWRATSGADRPPDSCLINFYGEGARMGMHQDRDEADTSWPVVSLSLGDEALFRIGQTTRGGKTVSHWLQSGDVAVLAGDGRLVYHGIDRIKFGSSSLLPDGGRINVTLRIAR